MKSLEILEQEHRIIELALRLLEKIKNQCITESRLDKRLAGDIVSFFLIFADRCHNGKEETYLFPMLETKGLPQDRGRLRQMIYEHEQSQQHLCEMTAAISSAPTGNKDALQQFIDHAEAYIELLRLHIWKEERCVYPIAKEFSAEEEKSLLSSLIKDKTMDLEVVYKYRRMLTELTDQLCSSRVSV